MKLAILQFWKHGNGLSGGDIIAKELGKRFDGEVEYFFSIKTNPEHGILDYFQRTLEGVIRTWDMKSDIVYSSSDFYPDLIPALLMKLRKKASKWIAGYYLVAPHPFFSGSPYNGKLRFRGLLYWLTQRLSLWIVNLWADVVFVTSEPDIKYFPGKKVIVVRGGVSKFGEINQNPEYDAVFVGRFHYQKGVLELLDIWKKVVMVYPYAKLIMIGDGPLKNEVFVKRHKLGLDSNIILAGPKQGEEKYKIFEDSRIFVHPATYDSGGFSCAEAMAFGLPAVGFDLEAYRTYYPRGMIKCADSKKFAMAILLLLKHKFVYDTLSKEAKDLTLKEWNWDTRANEIWKNAI